MLLFFSRDHFLRTEATSRRRLLVDPFGTRWRWLAEAWFFFDTVTEFWAARWLPFFFVIAVFELRVLVWCVILGLFLTAAIWPVFI